MRPRTREILYQLLWTAELAARPTFRNLSESFESWVHRNGHLRHVKRLEARQWIERTPGVVENIFRLTDYGKLQVLGGCDPTVYWNRPWDERWRIVSFDLPEKHNAARVRLRRGLKDRRFGFLQNSFWISPDPMDAELRALGATSKDVEAFFAFETHLTVAETNQAVVLGAWNFDRLQKLHEACLQVLARRPSTTFDGSEPSETAYEWRQEERSAWLAALGIDPLLPACLLPAGYLGRKVWQLRNETCL